MFSSPASSSSSSSSSDSSSYASGSGSGSSWSSPASSSSGSARSSPVHPGSLVDPATHAPALMQLIDIKLDPHVIDYVVDCVAETVDYAMGRTAPSSSVPPRGSSTNYLPKFTSFVSTVLSRAEVTPPTLLVALAYTHRARPHLSIALEEWALERVFLGALIAASKYTNDSTLKNVHWALCTGVFGKRDVGRIEREFLDVLDWELGVREADLLAHHEGLVRAAAAPSSTPASATTSVRTRTTARPAGARLAAPRAQAQTHHRRPSAGAVVPELEPSSPQSSLASMSPRTPPHSAHSSHPSSAYPSHSSAYAPYPTHRPAHPAPMAMDVDSEAPQKSAGKWNDILRSFPIPRHHRHVSASGRRIGVGA
ncbi:hypothetical protein DFH06DRAFT_50599 [Mycena polygramma]|nr:hypothetical protein DFH06DRAFT_50599 [Mycena polygramma]